jgi:hypothetical protein
MMPQQMEHDVTGKYSTHWLKREADSLGLQKEPYRFYSPEEKTPVTIDKKKKKKPTQG